MKPEGTHTHTKKAVQERERKRERRDRKGKIAAGYLKAHEQFDDSLHNKTATNYFNDT